MIDRYSLHEDGMRLGPLVRPYAKPGRSQSDERRFDFLTSMFTPSGTNARRGQEDQIRQIMQGAGGAFNALLPVIMQRIKGQQALYAQLAPFANQLASTLTPEARQARIERFGAGAREAAVNGARDFGLLARSQGWGDGASMGKGRGFLNSAARETGRYAGFENSPEGQAQQFGQVLGGLNNFNQWGAGDWNALLSLGSLINGQQPVMVQPGLGQMFGQVAGEVASAYGKKHV